MNFLLINQFFAPDPAPTGQLLADLARHLAARGHDVTVLCSRGAYANSQSAAAPGAGIRIAAVSSAPFRRGMLARLLSYSSFYAGALIRGLGARRPDVIVTMTTPPLLASIGALLRRRHRARHYIWEMDVYPDIAVAAGVLPARSAVTRALATIANACRRRADGVIALGPCMRDRLAAQGVPAGRLHVAENWADGVRFPARPVPAGPLTMLYSGNLGLAHDTGTIATAMDALKLDPRFRFVFAGGGPRRRALEAFCETHSIRNVAFLPYCEAASLPDHLASCHVGLVTQTPGSLGAVVPSKIYALMATGRPLLFIGPREATPARILDEFRCGWQVDPGDAAAAISTLRSLAENPELASAAGARARAAFEAHYDRPASVARIARILVEN